MLNIFARLCLVAGCFSLATLGGNGQEIVHALTGTVSGINPNAKTITVFTDNRSEGHFECWTNLNTRITFDKKLRSDAIPADAFREKGAYVIVFYFGTGDVRTVVALRNLGKGPFRKSVGTVLKFDRGDHLLTVKDQSGSIDSFTVNADLVVETGMGATEGLKYQPQRDEQVKVTSSEISGTATALLIVAM
jgi:hypothetical protein